MTLAQEVKKYFTDSTAMNAACTPVFAALDTLVLKIPVETSINARLLAGGLTFAGLGYVVAKGRDAYRTLVGVTDETRERIQFIHDSLYVGLANIVVTPGSYYVSGVRDLEKIAWGTAMAIAFGVVSGGLMGYIIDAYRDLTGVKKSMRLPSFIRERTDAFKKGLATALVAASLGLTVGIYGLVSSLPAKAADVKEKITRHTGASVSAYSKPYSL